MERDARGTMAIAAARLLRDEERVLVGVGLPNLAANIARLVHAPRLVLVYESGVIDARPPRPPLSIGDPDLVRTALGVVPILDLFSQYLQTGWIDVGLLGGAQIDRRGNLNSTVIGDYEHPRVRLSGSGGAADIASFARRTVVLMPQSLERFPAAVDFATSPGHPPGARRENGPAAVVTDFGLFDFDADGEMRLLATYEGVRVEDVQARIGWPLRTANEVGVVAPPDAAERAALRKLSGEERAADD